MPPLFLPASAHRARAWKNGLGLSRAIAESPAGATLDEVAWQVSATQIGADCPFSALPGVDRVFTVTEGAGVALASVDDRGRRRDVRVPPMTPYAFRGDWTTTCRLLDGPVKVFNVMTRRGKAAAAVEIARGGALEGRAGETTVAVDLESLDAWRLDGPGPIAVPQARTLGVVRIRPA